MRTKIEIQGEYLRLCATLGDVTFKLTEAEHEVAALTAQKAQLARQLSKLNAEAAATPELAPAPPPEPPKESQ